mgnify:CR=1 FL=1
MTAAPTNTKKYSPWKGEYDSLLEVFQSGHYFNKVWLENKLKSLLTCIHHTHLELTDDKQSMLNEFISVFDWDVQFCLRRGVSISVEQYCTDEIECDSYEDAVEKMNSGEYDDVDEDWVTDNCDFPNWEIDDVDVQISVLPVNLRLKEVSAA